MRQNGFSSIIIVLLLLVVIGVGGAFHYLTQVKNQQPEIIDNQNQTTEPRVVNNQPTSSPVSTTPAVQERKKFQSNQYKFSLTYPADWSYKENDPFVPNLAEYTVTFSAPDGNTGLDVWIRDGNWAGVEKDILKEKGARTETLAGYPAILQPVEHGSVVFVKHPSIANKILVFTSIGENLTNTDQIQKTLKFE